MKWTGLLTAVVAVIVDDLLRYSIVLSDFHVDQCIHLASSIFNLFLTTIVEQ